MRYNFLKHLLLLMLMMMSAQGVVAQEANDSVKKQKVRVLSVNCNVADHTTHNPMSADTLRGELLNAADSTVIDTLKVTEWGWGDWKQTNVSADITKPGKYIFRLFFMGYEPKYVPFEIKKLYKNELTYSLKTAYMKKQKSFTDQELNEVVVKATKLKFYMDGDTLTYDADAFNMSEGSMLGQLIKQLPGVEVESGGEIKVNGKKVDAMLLNGKDFFDSDRELLLDNMPSYMVKNVQSFERTPESAKGTNKEKSTQKELVLNVKLKKEYNTGWLVTATGGAGASFAKNEDGKHDMKYMGRLFATRFDDKSRFLIYGNVNNVNDQQTPGESGEYSELSQSEGITNAYNAGMNYHVTIPGGARYMGSLTGSYTKTNTETRTSNETFLEGGNTFGRSYNNSLVKSWSLSTNHAFRMFKQKSEDSWYKSLHLQVLPAFTYSKNNNRSEAASLTLNSDVANNLGKDWVDSIKAPDAGELIRKYAINRSISSAYNYGHSLTTGVSGDFGFSPAHNDIFDFSTRYSYTYSDNQTEQFNHDFYEYPTSTQDNDFRNKYSPTINRSHSLMVAPSFTFVLSRKWGDFISLDYNYTYNYNKSNQSLYLLNKLSEWNSQTAHPIGELPSMDELLQTIDKDNSSLSETMNSGNKVSLQVGHSFAPEDAKYFSLLMADVSLQANHERIDYQRGTQVDTLLTRNTLFFSPGISYYYDNQTTGRGFNISYDMNKTAPSLLSMIAFVDTSDPLQETHNNPDLKNTTNHNLTTAYRDKFGRTLFNVGFSGSIIQNQVASGFIYNKDTGKRIITPENVNGNWNASGLAGIDMNLGKGDKWRLSDNFVYTYTNSVDLSGTATSETEGEVTATRSIVGSSSVNNVIRLNYRPTSKMEYSAMCSFRYQHSASERQDFTPIDAYDFSYGATGKMELPLGFQFATDITMYSRRGYSDSSMNTNELVWNVRLTKKFFKGNLLVQADGFDILGKLSNIQRTINAQGKTETFTNVLPSYFLIHLTYRFNKYPKNKPQK